MMNTKPTCAELELGAAVITPGSAREYETGDWRSFYPITDEQKCIACGVCWIFCPEASRILVPRKNKGSALTPNFYDFDPKYCKGCGICAQECPTHAIKMAQEEI